MYSAGLEGVYRNLQAKAFKEGYAHGFLEGYERGRVMGRQRSILRVLAIRFGGVPEELAVYVTQISNFERLAVLLDSAATATNLADFERTLD